MKNRTRMKNFKGGPRNLFFMAFMFALGIVSLARLTEFAKNVQHISYDEFVQHVKNGQIKSVTIDGQEIAGVFKEGGKRFETVLLDTPVNSTLLLDNGVKVDVVPASNPFSFWYVAFLAIVGFAACALWFLFRQTRGSGGGAPGNIFSIGKSKAKMFMPAQVKVNFSSVAGVHEAKEELKDVVDFLKNPEKYRRLGAKLTRGVLLVGEPGNGKTMLAKAVAGEANCPFFSVSGSDFIEIFVGVGAARVRDLVGQARKHSPSIIFIDEIDAIGRARSTGIGGGHEEREQTLNQLLSEMDGFDSTATTVVFMAATNRPDILDKALLRPGRFDRRVYIPYPDLKSREEILKIHTKAIKIDGSVNMHKLARGTTGFSGADLANLVNEAAIHASKTDKLYISINDFEEARDKIILGKERKTIVMSEEERLITAYHEGGHALTGLMMPEDVMPLHKVTIIPRGGALGLTCWLPERDKYLETKEELLASIVVAMGGRVAEELIFNKASSGAYSDFQEATRIARKMVRYLGMTEEIGQVVYHERDDIYSENTARKIDEAVRRIIDSCYEKARALLTEHRDKLELLAQALLERETMYASEIYTLLQIEPREDHRLV